MSLFSLDTLVQLPHKEIFIDENETQRDLKKRAIRLSKTKKLIWPLIDLHSDLEKQYWSSYHCCRELKQEGNYLSSKYCNKRWCFECNAIRAAKMINGYMPIFRDFKNKQFVTLTRPNVPEDQLNNEVRSLVKDFQLCVRYLRERKKIDLKGLRKIEVTFNWQLASFHPHIHVIIDTLSNARALVDEWLFRNKTASPDAQNIRVADEGSAIELFKYATKSVVEKDMSCYALDVIFRAISGIRIYQPFGIKKYVSEDVKELVRQAYGMLEPTEYKIWRFNDELLDWFSIYDESLIKKNSFSNSS